MANRSRIEWTEATWNPVTGCTKVSAGCKHCYAETMAKRLHAMGTRGYENGFRLTLQPDRLEEPLRHRKPTVYFVNSMSDLYHPSVPDAFIDQVFEVIQRAPQHIFQILTKRADRLPSYFANRSVPANVWLGVSVENRRHGVPRIDLLRQVRASVRFLSIEPLLEDVGAMDLSGIHWVIVGGESGPKARPMQQSWVLDIKRQCRAQDVAFFFKQWGVWGPDGVRRSKHANGRILRGRTWDELPDVAVTA
jgi:protein gp37